MITIKSEDLFKKRNLDFIIETMNSDGVLVYPTDTLYGLGCSFHSRNAIKKIDMIKKRDNLPYSVAVSDISMIERIVLEIPDVFNKLNATLLPGKFTFLLLANLSLPVTDKLLKGSNKIGIRIPDTPNILKLIKKLKIPLVTTSVNHSGEKPLNDPHQIVTWIKENLPKNTISILIDGGPLPDSDGSTIIDLTQTPVKVIRIGDDYQKLFDCGVAFNS